jgi:hypothetical protein
MFLFTLLSFSVQGAEIDWDLKRQALGRDDKFRILVDVVLSKSNEWILTGTHMDEIKDAGFNVIVPRRGYENMRRVKRIADMAAEREMFSATWMRGALKCPELPKDENDKLDSSGEPYTRKRTVWANGTIQDIYSPNSDELWDWMTDLILGHAKVSMEAPNLLGTFLDFEDYFKKTGKVPRRLYGLKYGHHPYGLSYDDEIIEKFASAQGITIPDLKASERAGWLEKNGMAQKFNEFQINHWRERCRKLRQAIDEINPKFQLLVYPGQTLFLNEAAYYEWGTEEAPLIIAPHETYARKRGKDKLIVPHDEGLKWNRRILSRRLAYLRHAGYRNYMCISGIDPICAGGDPEYCAKNASMISEISDGYWVFYEGPSYGDVAIVTRHNEGKPIPGNTSYFRWFKRANHDISKQKFQLQYEPREEKDLWAEN